MRQLEVKIIKAAQLGKAPPIFIKVFYISQKNSGTQFWYNSTTANNEKRQILGSSWLFTQEANFNIWFVVAWSEFLSYWNSQIVMTGEERIFVQKQKKNICFLRFKLELWKWLFSLKIHFFFDTVFVLMDNFCSLFMKLCKHDIKC